MEAVLEQPIASTNGLADPPPAEHPIYPPLRAEAVELMGADWCARYNLAREQTIAAEKADPLRNGYEPEVWRLADFHRAELRRLTPKGVIHEVNLGGNRASKTERAAKRIMQFLIRTPNAHVWCCDSTQAQSRANQMRLLWKYFPPEWKNEETGSLKRTAITKVKYSKATGFTEDTFVLPNGAQCTFKFYGMSVEDLEGPELDIIWADELVPLDWIETLVYRLVTRNGLMHVTFTPKTGYTPTVGRYLDGARTVEEVPAALLPVKDADNNTVSYKLRPRVQFCEDQKARIIYFHTIDNPFGNYEAMVEEVKGKPEHEVDMRVYGYVTKAAHTQFPTFKDNVHVLSMNQWEAVLKRYPNGTRYQLVDPCSGRNWFFAYAYFPFPKKCIIYREWPSYGHRKAYIEGHGDLGPWALPSRGSKRMDGEKGPAQDKMGLGLLRYKEEMLRVEEGESIYERWIDSRYSNATKTEREGETTLVEQMDDIGMKFNAMTSEKNILDDRQKDGSVDMIDTALQYDANEELGKFSASLGRINEPWLQVVENCPNVIFSMKNWTGQDGQHGACKDPIDVVRGLFLSELEYRDEAKFKPMVPWLNRRR